MPKKGRKGGQGMTVKREKGQARRLRPRDRRGFAALFPSLPSPPFLLLKTTLHSTHFLWWLLLLRGGKGGEVCGRGRPKRDGHPCVPPPSPLSLLSPVFFFPDVVNPSHHLTPTMSNTFAALSPATPPLDAQQNDSKYPQRMHSPLSLSVPLSLNVASSPWPRFGPSLSLSYTHIHSHSDCWTGPGPYSRIGYTHAHIYQNKYVYHHAITASVSTSVSVHVHVHVHQQLI